MPGPVGKEKIMTATLTRTPVRDANVRIEWTPTLIAGVLIQVRNLADIPETLRDHAHRIVGESSRNEWWTVGQFRDGGRHGMRWLVAKRRLDGTVMYGTEA